MKKILLIKMFIFLIILNCYSQNLVENYSFENYNFTSCQISNEFSDILISWDSPNNKVGDVYFTIISQDCYYYQPNSTYSGPIGLKGSENPSEGEVFVGIWVYTIDGLEQREYIRGQLSNVLEEGNTYSVKMKISLADYMESYVGELGIAFMETQDVQTIGDLVDTEPQLIINSGLDVRDGWFEFDTSFISDGNYKYFIIGNFKSDENTETIPNSGASGAVSTYGAYYYFDEISVELEMVNSVSENEHSLIEVYPSIVKENIMFKIKGSNINNCRIVNQFGQILKEEKINNRKEGSFECAFLKPGIYYLISQDKNGLLLSTSKFIKMK